MKDQSAYSEFKFSIPGKTKRRSITPDLKKNCSQKRNLTPSKSNINNHNKSKKQVKKSKSTIKMDTTPKKIEKQQQNYFAQENNYKMLLRKKDDDVDQLKVKVQQLKQQAKIKDLKISQFEKQLQKLKKLHDRNVRKYKLRAKLKTDQLNLLKWILKQKKQFKDVVDQFQNKLKSGNLYIENYNSADRVQISNQKKEENFTYMKSNIEDFNNTDTKSQNKATTRFEQQNNNQKLMEQQEYEYLLGKIDYLQQQLMEMNMKNQLLQGMQNLKKQESKSIQQVYQTIFNKDEKNYEVAQSQPQSSYKESRRASLNLPIIYEQKQDSFKNINKKMPFYVSEVQKQNNREMKRYDNSSAIKSSQNVYNLRGKNLPLTQKFVQNIVIDDGYAKKNQYDRRFKLSQTYYKQENENETAKNMSIQNKENYQYLESPEKQTKFSYSSTPMNLINNKNGSNQKKRQSNYYDSIEFHSKRQENCKSVTGQKDKLPNNLQKQFAKKSRFRQSIKQRESLLENY